MLITVAVVAFASTLPTTSYDKMNCSQFACYTTGHNKASARQLFEEGSPGFISDAQTGDIVAFHGAHVAVMTDKGLMDSTPERGVGLVRPRDLYDSWYYGPVRIIRSTK